jgi:hypothetical protein
VFSCVCSSCYRKVLPCWPSEKAQRSTTP